ncbi:54S ribosomal protein L39, mitochondrial [Chytridiales sp. JEL 0842]|nr:54S ribosomal protein L39, mitochondrial [Chytridiales sp. JEL 0842]
MPLEYALQHRGRFEDPGPWKLPKSTTARLTEPLGIGHLPAQRVRRSKRRPYVFNIMVVGEYLAARLRALECYLEHRESGLGKTTFMNTLFNAPLNEEKNVENLGSTKTVSIQPTTYELVEDGVVLHLTVIDTPGFGDQLNRETNFQPIIEYIDTQYERYLQAERSQEMRRDIIDTRVHALLYFIPPTGSSGLRDLDIEFLQRLCTKTNVVPVIAKADALTPEEAPLFKKLILRDFEKHDIRVYPTHHAEDRENVADFERLMPFSVIGSDDLVDVGGKKVRGRSYRWGSVQVENADHCDFIYLRELLIRSNLQDLIETTHNIHYAQYRSSQIRGQNGRPDSFLACDEFYESRIENAKRQLAEEMQRKEDEMRQKFVAKVREKEASLREREEALSAKRQQMVEEIERMRSITHKAIEHRKKLWEAEVERQKSLSFQKQDEEIDVSVLLPDGRRVDVKGKKGLTTPLDVVKGRKGILGKNEELLMAQVDSNYWDSTRPLDSSCELSPILSSFIDKYAETPELSAVARSAVWHSAAHLLGWSMETNFGDDVLLVDGPALEGTGNIGGGYFYDGMLVNSGTADVESRLERAERLLSGREALYDAAFIESQEVSPLLDRGVYETDIKDLLESIHQSNSRIYHVNESHFPSIQTTMKTHAQTFSKFERLVVSRNLAAAMFAYNPLKLYIFSRIPAHEPITLYKVGDFIDLCRGPHVPHTGLLKNTQILRTSASQWLNVPGGHLSRVVGITFPSNTSLTSWLKTQKEAATRDHRNIGKQQSLFYTHPYSPGSPFMLPHGTRVASRLMEMVRNEYRAFGFEEVVTPLLFNKELWVKSGHWENYKEDINEASGALTGLTRVRKFHQDDAHIFCTPTQILSEIKSTLVLIEKIYTKALHFPNYTFALSTRPTKFIGDIQQWDEAESALKSALEESGKKYYIKEGDGAFYGPKIDVTVQDALGRPHQTATVQLDFQLPQRFNLKYVQEDGSFGVPVMIHRAALGSVERMMGVLMEHYGGRWPFWMSPRQCVVLPATSSEKVVQYALAVAKALKVAGRGWDAEKAKASAGDGTSTAAAMEGAGVAVVAGDRFYHVEARVHDADATLGKRVRDAWVSRYNFVVVVGERELEEGTVSVRFMESSSILSASCSSGVSEKPKEKSMVMTVEELVKMWEQWERDFR